MAILGVSVVSLAGAIGQTVVMFMYFGTSNETGESDGCELFQVRACEQPRGLAQENEMQLQRACSGGTARTREDVVLTTLACDSFSPPST